MATIDTEHDEPASQPSAPAESESPRPSAPAEDPEVNGHVEPGPPPDTDAEDAGVDAESPVPHEPPAAPDRSKVLPSPAGDEEPSTPVPPTPSTKRLPTRTDSLRSTAAPSPLASPRGTPAALAFVNQSFVPNGRDSPALGPPTPGSGPHRRSLTLTRGKTVSSILISSALDTIAAAKEAKRAGALKDSVQHALELVRAGEGGDRPREIFEPLRLACETNNEKLMVASLDCISKLISHSFFLESAADEQHPATPLSPTLQVSSAASIAGASQESIMPPSLVDLVVHTITSCHAENTTDAVSLQIVKALLALVLSSTLLVHQSSLLKAVRTVWNVFLLSMDPVTQTVAQGGLTQMVHHVFTRCHVDKSEEPDESVFPLRNVSSEDASSLHTDTVSVTPSTPPETTASPSEVASELRSSEDRTSEDLEVNGSNGHADGVASE
jgi:brefeldin A-inhibited guanine nucleotide-exchange protein